jgi:class 3 adenylate cyclase
MKCLRYQAENQDGARFEDGGARLEICCAACGQPVGADKRFCRSCGAADKRFCRSCGAALFAQRSRFASPRVNAPKHLADRILTSKAPLEGERKQVTVLFADLKGSVELLADRDPEEARKLLDPVLVHIYGGRHRYEGMVNQVMGRRDHGALRRTAGPRGSRHPGLLRRAGHAGRHPPMRGSGPARSRRDDADPRRLNSGEVVVHTIDSDLRMDYTARGQITYLAARMEQLANPAARC